MKMIPSKFIVKCSKWYNGDSNKAVDLVTGMILLLFIPVRLPYKQLSS